MVAYLFVFADYVVCLCWFWFAFYGWLFTDYYIWCLGLPDVVLCYLFTDLTFMVLFIDITNFLTGVSCFCLRLIISD